MRTLTDSLVVLLVLVVCGGVADAGWLSRLTRFRVQLPRLQPVPPTTTTMTAPTTSPTTSTTTSPTTTRRTTPLEQGCRYKGHLYKVGESFGEGYDPKSNWCYGYYCNGPEDVYAWDDFNCKPKRSTTGPPPSTS